MTTGGPTLAPGKQTRVQQESSGTSDALGRLAVGAPGRLPHLQRMEAAFGEDFSGVRAQVGAPEITRPFRASAVAVGDMVAFASAQPSVGEVAHELSHVVQERRNGGSDSGGVSRRTDTAEAEAEAVAAEVEAGRHAPPLRAAATTDSAQIEDAGPVEDAATEAEPAQHGAQGGTHDAGDDTKASAVSDAAGRDVTATAPGSAAHAADEVATPLRAPSRPVAAPAAASAASEVVPALAGSKHVAAHSAAGAAPEMSGKPGQRFAAMPPQTTDLSAPLDALGALRYGDLEGSVGRVHQTLHRTQEAQRVALAQPQVATVNLATGDTAPPPPDLARPLPKQPPATHDFHRALIASAQVQPPTPSTTPGKASLGARPAVPLVGAALPQRASAARTQTHQAATAIHGDAVAATAANFGERSAVPNVSPVHVAIPPAPVSPIALPPPRPPPKLSPGLGSALDTVMGPELATRTAGAQQRVVQDNALTGHQLAQQRAAAEAEVARIEQAAQAEQRARRMQASARVDSLRGEWRGESDALVADHHTRTERLHTTRLAAGHDRIATGRGHIDRNLSQAEQQCDSERSAAQARADEIRAAARGRAVATSSAPQTGRPVMRQNDAGTSDGAAQAPDEGQQILADAEREAQEAMARAEQLIQQMILAAQNDADADVARLSAELDQLFADLETQLADANRFLDAHMALVGEQFRAQITAEVDEIKLQAETVRNNVDNPAALLTVSSHMADAMAGHQARVSAIFDDAASDWRTVQAAEAISAACQRGDCFERNTDGSYQIDSDGNLIPNLTPVEYMLLFQAVEIQTGIPARVLKAIAIGETGGHTHNDAIPRQFYDGSMVQAQATMHGRARWAQSELGEDAPPVAWGDDRLDNNNDGVVDGPNSRGMGMMQLTAMFPDIQAAWETGGTVDLEGVPVDVRRAIFDPYYNITQAAALIRQKQHDFPAYPQGNPDSDWDWALVGSLFQTRHTTTSSGADYPPEQRIYDRMTLTPEALAALQSGELAGQMYYNSGRDNLLEREAAVSNADVLVPSDPGVPIPDNLYVIQGELYQLSGTGREAGFRPVNDATIEMDGHYYAYSGGDLVEVPAPADTANVIHTDALRSR